MLCLNRFYMKEPRVVAQIHDRLMHLNDNFELYFGDKDMLFIVRPCWA